MLPGTANHVATVPTPAGPVSLVTYQEPTVGAPAGEEFMICVAQIGSDGTSGTCAPERNQKPDLRTFLVTVAGPRSGNSMAVYGGDDAVLAILVTERRVRIGITTVGGWAYAQWPRAFGRPASITFYDSDANPGYQSTY